MKEWKQEKLKEYRSNIGSECYDEDMAPNQPNWWIEDFISQTITDTALKVVEAIEIDLHRKDGWFNALKMEIYKVMDKYYEFGARGFCRSELDLDEIGAACTMYERRLSQKLDEIKKDLEGGGDGNNIS